MSSPLARSPRRAVAFGMILATLTLAVYAPVLRHEFLNYDDPEYVTANPEVARGLTGEGVRWAFTTTRPHNWHPVTWLSHMLDVHVHGMDAGWHHLGNVLLHALNTVLLFGLLCRMTGAAGRSAFVAALFALHPLHVESVAWVAERKDVLSTFFWMLAAWAYVEWVRRGRWWRYVLVMLTFALGLMSKPMVVTFPFVMLLLDFWPLGRAAGGESIVARWRPLVIEKVPLLAFATAGSAVTLLAQHDQAMSSLANVPLSLRLANAMTAYVAYVGATFWPGGLAVFYPYPAAIPAWRVALAVTVLLAASGAAVSAARTRPYLAVGWFWFLGALVPVIGLAQAGIQALADRFTYVPLIGLFLVVAWGVPELLASVRHRRAILVGGAAAAVASCIVLTSEQLRHWRISETLFRHALAVTRGNFVAHNNLAEALMQTGRVEEATEHFAASVRLEPRFPHAHHNLASALLAQDRVEDAVAHYSAALRLAPEDAEIHRDLGLALYRRGDVDAAIEHLTTSLRIRPDDARAHNNLAAALAKRGDLDAAIVHYAEALRLDPEYERARRNLEAARAAARE